MGNEESSLIDDSIQPMTLKSRDIDGLAEYLKSGKVKKVVVMTGAGISTSAGIPDFRSPETGLYANLARLDLPYAEAVFDISYFRRNPLPFYTLAHELYPGKFRPTIVHSFIRLLNDKNMLLKHFTQNIDILDRKAGVPADKIIEAHGSFARQSCIECNTKFPDAEMKKHIDKKEVPHCKSPKCDGLVKPEIVFFGEALPHEFFLGRGLPAEADLCIVLGSSLTVHPFASLPELVSEGTPRVLINLERVGSLGSRPDDVLLLGDCDEQVKKLAEKAGWLEELERLWDATALEGDKEENEKAEQPRKGEITEAQKNPGTTEEKDKALEDEVDKLTKDIDESLKVSGKHIEDNKNEPTGPPTDDGGKGQSHVEPDGKKDSSL